MLRVHLMQQCFTLSDPAMEEAPPDVSLFQEFAGRHNGSARLPFWIYILRFRRLLERKALALTILAATNELPQAKGVMLRAGNVIDTTLTSAPSSTKKANGLRDHEMNKSR